jgi:hypothetical protein
VTAGGKDTGISLRSEDVEVSRFGEVPPLFWFRDPEGNSLMVVQMAA